MRTAASESDGSAMRMTERGSGMVGVRREGAPTVGAPRRRRMSGEDLREVTIAGRGGGERVATLRRAVLLDVEVLHPGERRLREDRPVVDLALAERDDARRAMPLALAGHAVERSEAGDVLHVPDLEASGCALEQLE